jgi:hypothetical protein
MPTKIAKIFRWFTLSAAAATCAAPSIFAGLPAPSANLETARKTHWSYQPVQNPKPPAVKDAAWCVSPIDRFVLARLEAAKVSPSPAADRRTLIRRASFDLLGVPPTEVEVEAFVADRSPEAFAAVVDRLLASPLYGQRWARHWLDVARYADTKGYVGDNADRRYPFAYTYRDYVIDAFNNDLPYDQFVIQQLAADQMELGADKRPLAALGFLTVGRRFINNINDITDDRIDVVTRGLMGLTVQCARCHDHKYDAIPAADYYSLYGVFRGSVEPLEPELPVIREPMASPEYQAFKAEFEKRQKAVADFKATYAGRKANQQETQDLWKLEHAVTELLVNSPAAPPRAMVMNDTPQPFDPHVFLRGNQGNPGDAVPRRFLQVLSMVDEKPFEHGSGRIDLARDVVSPKNPLTARVMVNRVWMHHFGVGLVRTTSDFGARGEPPSHPELLDWLATRFMQSGWSLKQLHRTIMLTSVYQQASNHRDDAAKIDPENRLLWKMNRSRLSLEAMRDSMLIASNRLDAKLGGPGVELYNAPFTTRRAVYGYVDRQDLPGTFRVFDFAIPEASAPMRPSTVVPQQALYMLNNGFVLEQSQAVLNRGGIGDQPDLAARVTALYRVIFQRTPATDELELATAYIRAESGPAGADAPKAWQSYVQALLMSDEFMFVD